MDRKDRCKPSVDSAAREKARRVCGWSEMGGECQRALMQCRGTVPTDFHVRNTPSVGGAHAARGGALISVTPP